MSASRKEALIDQRPDPDFRPDDPYGMGKDPRTVPPREPLLTREIFQSAWDAFRATRSQTLLLAVFGLLLPQLVHLFYYDVGASSTTETLRAMVESGATGTFMGMIQTSMGFYSGYLTTTAFLWLVFLATYFGMVHLVVSHFRGDRAGLGQAVRVGLRMIFPRGLALTGLLMMLGLAAQYLVAPAVLVAILGLVVPVIIVTERAGAFSAAWNAITLRYSRGSNFTGWGVLFTLSTIGALFYTAMIGLSLGAELVLRLDEWLGLSRTMWAARLGDLPFGPIYLMSSVAQIAASVVLIGFLPAVTTALYFKVVGTRELARV